MLRLPMSGALPLLQPVLDAARSERTMQRVLLSGGEGVGRTRALGELTGAMVVPVGQGPLVVQTLRQLLGELSDDEAALRAIRRAPALAALEPDRATVAAELLASQLGIRRASFRTAALDEDSRREGAALELVRWVVDRATTGVFVIAFDDAHLADDEGVAFLDALVQREEALPLVVVVSHDANASRHTPAFRARRDVWSADPRWRRQEVKPPARDELVRLANAAGLELSAAQAVVTHASGNPALTLGLIPLVRGGHRLSELPRTLDELRVLSVKRLGDEVLATCTLLATLGGAAPLAALAAIDPALPAHAAAALAEGVLRLRRAPALEVLAFAESRLVPALAAQLTGGRALGARLAAGAWAVDALEHLEPSSFARMASVLVPLAKPALEGQVASEWDEAWALTLGTRAESVSRLESALRTAHGIRRLVLLRRLAETKLFLGLPADAIGVLGSAGRTSALGPAETLPPGAVGRLLAGQRRGILDRWEALTLEEATLALDLVRAECLSHLVRKDETQRAFADLERRLLATRAPSRSHLLIRWAKAWSWFASEILGRAPEAMRACGVVRREVPPDVLSADEDAIAFVRAEEVATSSVGDFTRARALTEEHLALAERSGKLRDACLAWNARAIVHYGQGELLHARRAFERALDLARTTGWLRREAITLHNLTLVLSELGELEQGFAAETTYARLSEQVGNHAGQAEAPLVLAGIELARGRLVEAERLLTQARKVADLNGWDMLVAQGRALVGRLRLLRYRSGGDALEVTKAKNDLLAAIEVLEERQLGWTEDLDPGEVFGLLALALKWSGQQKEAERRLDRAQESLPKENVVSRQQLEVARAVVQGRDASVPLQWFDERGFKRRVSLWQRW